MKKEIKICASVACADLLHLSDEIRALEEAKVDYLHYDIMDGVFVPNITFGFDVMKQLKKITDIPIDCHLMIQQPEQYISEVAASGASAVAVHAESDLNLQRALSQIRAFGLKAGVVLNPATPLDVLDYVLDDIDYVVIMQLSEPQRMKLAESLFDKNNGIGLNFCRTHIGSADFSLSEYTYVKDEDKNLKSFTIDRDRKYIVPMIKAAQKYSKDLYLFASPWSPPAWTLLLNYGRLVGMGAALQSLSNALLAGNAVVAWMLRTTQLSAFTRLSLRRCSDSLSC